MLGGEKDIRFLPHLVVLVISVGDLCEVSNATLLLCNWTRKLNRRSPKFILLSHI